MSQGKGGVSRLRATVVLPLCLVLVSVLVTAPVRSGASETGFVPDPMNDATVLNAPQVASLAISKSLVSPTRPGNVLLIGEQAVFDIVITNTSNASERIAYLPLQDLFDTICLDFIPKASPPESSYDEANGTIDWANLTVTNSTWLPPGGSFTTQIVFDVVGPTGTGLNTAVVSGALDGGGGPVTPNPAVAQVSFTCAEPASISGRVWNDQNASGTPEPGEPGIAGVKVELQDGGCTPGVSCLSKITDGNGDYSFTMLVPGAYTVDVDDTTLPAGFISTTGNDPTTVNAAAGGSYTVDFGYYYPPSVTVEKRLLEPINGSALISQTVIYEIDITNHGQSTITTLPLYDYYSPSCLEIPSTMPPATGPATNPTLGVLHWANLGPLAPGDTAKVMVAFHANITDAMYWKEGGWIDYAPKGMPDFDQKQDAWNNPGPNGPGWYYCGPVAVANSFWWFDSKFEPNPVPPPALNDTYPLVQSYAPGQPNWDDHDPRNVQPLANDLAGRMGTLPGQGTNVHNMVIGIQAYLSAKGLLNDYTVTLHPAPPFEWVEDEVRRSEDVILLLGFWTPWGDRVGGHYVTVAGIDSLNKLIGFSDPYRDRAEAGGLGRILPNPHPHPLPASEVHNDAKFASHDVYQLAPVGIPGFPAGSWGPAGYANLCDEIQNFAMQNSGDWPNSYSCSPGEPILTIVEYAVAVSPLEKTLICAPTNNIAVVSEAVDEFDVPLPEAQAHTPVSVFQAVPASGTVWNDLDGSGSANPGEPGLPGVTVELQNGICTPALDCLTQITDNNGAYTFANLLPGNYTLVEYDPVGFTSTGDAFPPNDNKIPLVILPLQDPAGLDFFDQGTGSIGDLVWLDPNGDPVQDPGELGIYNVGLTLTWAGPDGLFGSPDDYIYPSTNTNLLGIYSFGNLPPGSFQVSINAYNPQLAGKTQIYPDNTGMIAVALAAGQAYLAADFGYQLPTGLTLHHFSALADDGQVLLRWAVDGDAAHAFHVWRADNAKGLNALMLTTQPLVADPGGEYLFVDRQVVPGLTYWYWLEDVADGLRYGPQAVNVPLLGPRSRVFLPIIYR